MGIWELLLIAVAVSMDAFAVGMADGMYEPAMSFPKHMAIAFAFGFFQFMMPVVGYYAGTAFAELVQRIAPWLAFVLLGILGGKSVISYALGQRSAPAARERGRGKTLGAAALFAQAVATSIDALAVGVTLLAAEKEAGLPLHAVLCALLIGMVTFGFSAVAVRIGAKAGDRFAARAELAGGAILVLIGLKLLLEGVL